MSNFHKIRKLKELGKNNTQIAKELNLHRETVRRYLMNNSPPQYAPRAESGKIDHFKDFAARVGQLLKNKENFATDIFELIKEEGYQGSYRTLAKRIAELRAALPKERFFEQKFPPGLQSQFDFKEKVSIPFTDGAKILHLHFGVLPYSSTFYISAFPSKNFESFATGMHQFFQEIGGITKEVRIDNLSPCVMQVLQGKNRKYTAAFQRFLTHYGLTPSPCAPGKGSDKGKVEREIRTQAHRIQRLCENKNLIFEDLNAFNVWLKEFCAKRQTDCEALKKEKEHLLPLPRYDEDILCKIHESVPSKFGTITFEGGKYSVPDNLIGIACRVIASPSHVKIVPLSTAQRKIQAAVLHERKPSGENSVLLEHCISSLVRKPSAMVFWSHRETLFQTPGIREYFKFLEKSHSNDAQRLFLQSVNLVQHVPLQEIALAMTIVTENKSQSPYEDLRCLLLQELYPSQAALKQPQLRINMNTFNSLIPQSGAML